MNYLTSGCLGDWLYSIPSVRFHGKGNYYCSNRSWTKPIENRLPSIKRLLESQDCILSAEVHHGQPIDIDFSTFRKGGMIHGDTIINRQARWSRAKVDLTVPWIMVEPDSRSSGRIVINECPRWESWFFPWRQIVQTFGNDLLFIGLPDEHNEFQQQFGKVPYLRTDDLYDAARLIKGSELFIGNQSSCNSIAEGLHHRKILAVCLHACDCLYPRDGATYCIDGSLSFEACGKSFHSEAVKFIPKNHSGNDWDKPALLARVRQLMIDKGI